MADSLIQTAFHAGEWAPTLYARVDLAKYKSGAALLRNYFVDYRGGASSRMGTKYINQAYKSATAVRVIPFQASFSVSYALEFGDFYIRFYSNGEPVLEDAIVITGATQANPCVVSVGNSFSIGDWVFITDVVGMTELNDNYYQLQAAAAGNVTLSDLNGNAIDSSGFSAYVSGGTIARVYTLPSPYAAADLATLKFAGNVNTMVLTHPNYKPYVLTLISAASWTLTVITFGSTIGPPTAFSNTTNLSTGSNRNYGYIVTSVDVNGQESGPSVPQLVSALDPTTSGTTTLSWTAVPGASSYNIYKTQYTITVAIATGAAYGFVGNVTGVSWQDTIILTNGGIAPDYSITPPVSQNPFVGSGVISVTVTAPGVYSTVPTIAFAPPSVGDTATGQANLGILTATVNTGGHDHSVGDAVIFPNGVVLIVASIGGHGLITAWQPLTYPGTNIGSITSGAAPASSAQTAGGGISAVANFTWGVISVGIVSAGTGYETAPAITFSSGAAAATASIASTIPGTPSVSSGNPAVPTYHQQRLALAAQAFAPQNISFSQPGSFYNYNVTNPIQPDNAISVSLVSSQLNTIKSMVSMPSGLIVLSDKAAWLINNGQGGAAITPSDIVANSHSYNGASDVPPIVANFDILYVQSKGSIVRDLTYNFYANIFTGTDISILSSHLFYGYTVLEWAWAEEPFKIVWAVRNDGTLLSLTYLKEQELIGWAHSDTTGLFKSVCVVTETVSFGSVDALYTVVERVINGNTVKYIERMAERIFPNGVADAWCVDAGIQYDGAPATTFTGAQHLAGATVTGLADGVVITPFVMPIDGTFTLATAASKVTVGLGFTAELETLPLNVGSDDNTVQGKMKSINTVVVRVVEALGLTIGTDASNQVAMKDLVIGNVGSMTNTVVTGLVTGDARTKIDPNWDTSAQYLIRQPNPLPATILGVIPDYEIGDTGSKR